ncbi:MAG: RNA 2'-phosphotransferase [Thermofilum sp.]
MKPIYRCRRCGVLTEEELHCGTPAELVLEGDRRERLSKLMSGALRHFPEALGLHIDEEGFTAVSQLAAALRSVKGFEWVTENHVRAVAAMDPKGRFELAGEAIRARYGHSLRVRIRYAEEYPSTPLFHGTSRSKLASILKRGLLPMRRLFVHLTVAYEDALARALAHPDPVVLAVNPDCMKGRVKLFRASKTVYVAPYVPSECISIASGDRELSLPERAGES